MPDAMDAVEQILEGSQQAGLVETERRRNADGSSICKIEPNLQREVGVEECPSVPERAGMCREHRKW